MSARRLPVEVNGWLNMAMRLWFNSGRAQAIFWLRVGLIVVFAYAAVDAFVAPNDWVGYLPHFATRIISGPTLLQVFSIYEIGLVVWLVSGLWLRWAAVLSALTMVGIVVTNLGLFGITFRDLAIAAGALALAALTQN